MSRIAGTLSVQFVGDFSRLKQEYQSVMEELRKNVVPVSVSGQGGAVGVATGGVTGSNAVGSTASVPTGFTQPTGISAAAQFSANPAFRGKSDAELRRQLAQKDHSIQTILDLNQGDRSKIAARRSTSDLFNSLQDEAESIELELAGRSQNREQRVARATQKRLERLKFQADVQNFERAGQAEAYRERIESGVDSPARRLKDEAIANRQERLEAIKASNAAVREEASITRQINAAKGKQFSSEVRTERGLRSARDKFEAKYLESVFEGFVGGLAPRDQISAIRDRANFSDNPLEQQKLLNRADRLERQVNDRETRNRTTDQVSLNQGSLGRFSGFSGANDRANAVFGGGTFISAIFGGFEATQALGAFNQATQFAKLERDPEKILQAYLQANERIQGGFVGGILGSAIRGGAIAGRDDATLSEKLGGGGAVVGAGAFAGASAFVLTGSVLAGIVTGGAAIVGGAYLAKEQRDVEDKTNEALSGKRSLDAIDEIRELNRNNERAIRQVSSEGFTQQRVNIEDETLEQLKALNPLLDKSTLGSNASATLALTQYNKAAGSINALKDARLRRVAIEENRISQQFTNQALGLFATAAGVPDEIVGYQNLVNQQQFELGIAQSTAPNTVAALTQLQQAQRSSYEFQTGRVTLLRNISYQAETDIANLRSEGLGFKAARREIQYRRDRELVERPQDAFSIVTRSSAQIRALEFERDQNIQQQSILAEGQGNALNALLNRNPLQARLDSLRAGLQASLNPLTARDSATRRLRSQLTANEGRQEQLVIEEDRVERQLRLEGLQSKEAISSLTANKLPLTARAQSISNEGLLAARSLFEREGPEATERERELIGRDTRNRLISLKNELTRGTAEQVNPFALDFSGTDSSNKDLLTATKKIDDNLQILVDQLNGVGG
jgi:hypothetical protein